MAPIGALGRISTRVLYFGLSSRHRKRCFYVDGVAPPIGSINSRLADSGAGCNLSVFTVLILRQLDANLNRPLHPAQPPADPAPAFSRSNLERWTSPPAFNVDLLSILIRGR